MTNRRISFLATSAIGAAMVAAAFGAGSLRSPRQAPTFTDADAERLARAEAKRARKAAKRAKKAGG